MLYAGVRAHAGGGIDVNQLFGHHHLKCMKFLISLESQEPLKSLKYSKFIKLRNLRSLRPAKQNCSFDSIRTGGLGGCSSVGGRSRCSHARWEHRFPARRGRAKPSPVSNDDHEWFRVSMTRPLSLGRLSQPCLRDNLFWGGFLGVGGGLRSEVCLQTRFPGSVASLVAH